MNKLLLLALTGLISINVFAQTEEEAQSSETIETTTAPTSRGVKFELTAGYNSRSLDDVDNESFDGNGFALGAAIDYKIVAGFAGASGFNLNRIAVDTDEIGEEIDGRTIDFNYAQKFLYQFDLSNNFALRPFVEAGIGRGNWKLDSKVDAFDMQINYTKYSAAVGLQMLVNEIFLPFAKYEVATVKLDSTGEVSSSAGNYSFDVAEEYRDMDAKTIIVGVGVLF